MKNNKFLFYFFTIAAIIVIAGCKSCTPNPVENPPAKSIVTYEAGANMPDYKKMTLQNYQVVEGTKIDEAAAQKNVSQLLQYVGASSEFDMANVIKENGILFYKNPKDPSAILNVNLTNGDISLNRGTKAYMGLNSTPDLVKNEEAVKIAKQYLNKLNFGKGDESQMVIGHVGGVNMAIHDDKQGDKIVEKFTTVRFDRRLDNIPIVGHARLLVQMGSKGSIQSLVKQWAPLSNKSVSSESIVDVADAKKSIENHLISENKGAEKIVVKKIILIYYDTGKNIIEPALHIIAEVYMPANKMNNSRIGFKHDMVEPLLKAPRLSYTYTGEKHEMPRQSDNVDRNSEIPRGADEKSKQ